MGADGDRRPVRRSGVAARLRRGPFACARGSGVGMGVRRFSPAARARRGDASRLPQLRRADRHPAAARRLDRRPGRVAGGVGLRSDLLPGRAARRTPSRCGVRDEVDLRPACQPPPDHGQHRADGAGGIRRRQRCGGCAGRAGWEGARRVAGAGGDVAGPARDDPARLADGRSGIARPVRRDGPRRRLHHGDRTRRRPLPRRRRRRPLGRHRRPATTSPRGSCRSTTRPEADRPTATRRRRSCTVSATSRPTASGSGP